MTELIKTYLDEIAPVNLKLPALACDSHFHIFGPASTFPYIETRNFTPVDATKEQLFDLHHRLGIQRGVIVQTALHGYDNSATADAIATRPKDYLGVALAPAITGTEELKKLYQQGFRGIRFNFMAHLKTKDSMEDILALTHRLAPLGMHLQIHFEPSLVHSLSSELKKSAVPVMIDHMGRVDASLGVNHPDFQGLLQLLKDPKFHVKVSGLDRISKVPPYEDGIPFAKTLVDEFTERCVWGTDWPHPNHHHIPDDGVLVNSIARIADNTEKIEHIMVKNPHQFYGFGNLG
jgi:2-pyrone-4,6-dicarboxylate lactonase